MARAASLPSLGLSPFGGGGSSFDAFSIGQAKSEKAYLALRKVEVQWEAGQVSNADYLAALKTYAGTLKANTADRVGADARVEQYTYRFERDALEAQVQSGAKTTQDLLAYDRSKLSGLNPNSEEYQQRLGYVNSDQNTIFNEESDKQQELWNDGRLTTAQLMSWYQSLDPNLLADNKDLADTVNKAIDNLGDRVTDERDQKMLSDYSQGKVSPSTFLTYATAAQQRYAQGTTQYDDWTERIEDAKDKGIEDSILYRYDLTQRYQQLEKFVKDNGTAPSGHTTTSKGRETTRVVWDGSKWVTVKSRTGAKTTYHGPTAAQQQAWKMLQIEVADAKKEMAQIEKKVGTQAGGWVTTEDMVAYYKKIGSRYAVGTSEWYAVQGKLDGLNQQLHAEAVLKKQGIKITYPKVKSEAKEYGSGGNGNLPTSSASAATASASGAKAASSSSSGSGSSSGPSAATKDRNIGIDEFMRAIARVESGGRYDARNKTTGAYGKYQIMPSNWPAWAKRFLGDANAKPTPENQEKVARGKFLAMYKKMGDWRAVAHAWLTGDWSTDASTWSSSSMRYVNKVMGGLGLPPTKVGTAGARVTSTTGTGGAKTTTGGKTTAASGTGDIKTTAGTVVHNPDDGRKSVLDFPRGYDGRAYENFYSSFMDAWKSGQETFVDYSSGRAVAYFIPVDPAERAALAEELDQRRVDYYYQKASAYLNPGGSPTSTSLAAVRQATNAITDAAENHLYALSFEDDARKQATATPIKQTAGKQDADARYSGEQQGATSAAGLSASPDVAAKQVNPLAKGIELSNALDRQLASLASGAQRAYQNGDFELAYALSQEAVQAVNKAKPAIDTYLASASGQIRGVQQMGGTVPGQSSKDFTELKTQEGQLSAKGEGMDPSLKILDEVMGDLKKIVKTDPEGEPLRYGSSGRQSFVLNDNVNLIWKNGKLEIDTAAAAVGWQNPTTPATGKPQVTLGGVKVGSTVKTNVKSDYQIGVIGFVGGNENYPVYGKIVAGVDANGKPFQWAEDPIHGGWYSIASGPLNVKTPKGFSAMVGQGGGGSRGAGPTAMDYQFTDAQGNTHRLVFDQQDGRYTIYNAPSGLGGGDWVPVGKAGGEGNDLNAVVDNAGWGVDTSQRYGDDAIYSGTVAPVIGIGGQDYLKWLSPGTTVGNFGAGRGFKGGKAATPAGTFKGTTRQPDADSVWSPPASHSSSFRGTVRQPDADSTYVAPKKVDTGTFKGTVRQPDADRGVPTVNPRTGFVTNKTVAKPPSKTAAKPTVKKKATTKRVTKPPIRQTKSTKAAGTESQSRTRMTSTGTRTSAI